MLEEYQNKRDFDRTKEPLPKTRKVEGPLTFVVQKHSARRLHYDFRLELDGVLKSWAIPNGPSHDPKVKRLAVMVEDHPLDYGSFEGNIPEGQYGAGQVIVWDKGTYAPDEGGYPGDDRNKQQHLIRSGLEQGKISITLQGDRLKGSWALVKMKHTKNDWLLIKHKDDFAGTDDAQSKAESSVLSGLTIEELKAKSPRKLKGKLDLSQIPGAVTAEFPESLSPMLATLTDAAFSDPKWIFEPKLDGYRVLAFVRVGKAHLKSRRGLDVTSQYPFLSDSLNRQAAKDLVLDGEVVALDESGRPCFQCLQAHLENRRPGNESGEKIVLIYYVFDILYLDGYDLRQAPLSQRKTILENVLVPTSHLRPVEYFDTDGETLYETATGFGLEGVMAKLKDSIYEAGRRSRNWLKVKSVESDEFVIAGYTPGEGNRSRTFGALLLGSYDEKGKLVYNGNVGSGFDESSLLDLKQRLDKLKTDRSPFSVPVPLSSKVTWLRPDFVAEVKYEERTKEDYLRQPVFLRLREDKPPEEVRTPAPMAQPSRPAETKISPFKKGGLVGISETPDPVAQDRAAQASLPVEILDQLGNPSENFKIEVEGHQLSLTKLDKLLWPASASGKGFTKRDLLLYLAKASSYLLPHVHDRPITLSRYPDGIYGEHFWQKHWNHPLPEFVETVPLSENAGITREYLMCNNLATLLWLGQQGNIDLHTWFSRVTPEKDRGSLKGKPDVIASYPDFIIFDIDPYIYSGKEVKDAEPELNIRGFQQTCQAALRLKEVLDGLSLSAFVKTSGRTGLHVFVPVQRQFAFSAVHSAAKTIAGYLLQKYPQDVTMDWSVEKRTGKVFLDYNQNVRGKTLACIYSPRPSPEGAVSAPLRWDEVGKVYPSDFTLATMPARLQSVGDLWSGILEQKSDLGAILNLKS